MKPLFRNRKRNFRHLQILLRMNNNHENSLKKLTSMSSVKEKYIFSTTQIYCGYREKDIDVYVNTTFEIGERRKT